MHLIVTGLDLQLSIHLLKKNHEEFVTCHLEKITKNLSLVSPKNNSTFKQTWRMKESQTKKRLRRHRHNSPTATEETRRYTKTADLNSSATFSLTFSIDFNASSSSSANRREERVC